MFQIAVTGPMFADRLGVVRQCIECRAALGVDADPCRGFGPGCLVAPRSQGGGRIEAHQRRPDAVSMPRDGFGLLLDSAAASGDSAFIGVCFDIDNR